MRVGIGWDVQPYDAETPLILGGVCIPESSRCDAADDRDAVCRAIAEALLGATGLGSLRDRFEAREDQEEDLRSLELLSHCVRLLEEENYQVVNVDVLLVGKELAGDGPWDEMRARLARVVHTEPAQVSVRWSSARATVPGATDGDSLAALAVALVDQMQDIDVVHATMRSGG